MQSRHRLAGQPAAPQRPAPVGAADQQFAPLAEVPGVRLFSLQKGDGRNSCAALAGQFPVTDLGSRFGDLADTAAALVNLDLVVTVDTALAHLAGALGVPVWVAVPVAPDWRWLLGREDSPWYPSMRLFRQIRSGAWAETFTRGGALQELCLHRAEDGPRLPHRQKCSP